MNTSNTNHQEHNPQPELDQHIAAIRDEPVESNPPAATVAATLAMLRSDRISRDEVVGSRFRMIGRLIQMSFTQRIAAAVMVTVGALVLYVMFTLFSGFGATVALADVAEKLKQARTIQYSSTVTMPGTPGVTIRTLAAEPNRMRTEMPGGTVSIMNDKAFIILNATAKTATRTDFTTEKAMPEPGGNLVDALRSLGKQKGEPLGEKKIDGVATVGFRTMLAGRTVEIWADKKTAYPVRAEMTATIGGKDAVMVMDKFVIDAPLDDSLFSLEPPADYKLEKQAMTFPKIGEIADEVASLLRAYTEKSEGHAFPASLTDWADFIKVVGADSKATIARLGSISGTLFGSSSYDYAYLGKGVHLGDKDKIVFWSRAKDTTKYRAVFADLRVEEVAKDKLPATQPTNAPTSK